MDIKELTKQIEEIPDCTSLSVFVVDILAQVSNNKKIIADEILEVTEEILAGLTPISYVAWRVKKAKEKLARLNKFKEDMVDLVTLTQVVQAKMNRMGCVNNLAEVIKNEADALANSITTLP